MKKESPKYAQSTLFLRLLAGGYLIYTAWDIREAVHENPLFIIAIVAFAVIGAALLAHAGWKLYKGDYEGAPNHAPAEPEESKTEEEAEDE